MNTISDDGRLQVTAAASLLDFSHLVYWDRNSQQFTSVSQSEFDSYWRGIDSVFGRLICWINFSAGAEFLAKGVCLLNNVEVRSSKPVPKDPIPPFLQWAAQYYTKPEFAVGKVTNFGTLGDLAHLPLKKKKVPYLKQLCLNVSAKPGEEELLLAAYDFLARRIRNRDAHAYVPNVRAHHFWLVPALFADCFNILVGWLPGGANTLSKWRDEAEQFVSTI